MYIFDILIYVFFAWVMYNLAQKSYHLDHDGNKCDKYLKWFVFFFTIISAIRWNVGVDSVSYARGFATGMTGHELYGQGDETEQLSAWIIKFVYNLGLHFSVGLGIFAFLQIYFITLALKSHKYILSFVPILMFGSCYYLDLMNGVRQMIVACGFLWASRFIVEKKPWHYFGFIAIAYFMHNSALMLVPFYFIPNSFKIADRRFLLLTIYTLCFLAGLTPQFQSFMGYAEKFAILTGYEGYADRAAEFLSGGYTDELHALGPMQLSYLLIGYFIILFGPVLKKRYESLVPCFNLWYLFAFFYGSAYFLLTNTSHIFMRPVSYFSLFQMVIASLLLYDLFQQGRTKSVLKFVSVIFTCIIWTNTCWNLIKANTQLKPGETESATYKVFFMHMDEVRKEIKNY